MIHIIQNKDKTFDIAVTRGKNLIFRTVQGYENKPWKTVAGIAKQFGVVNAFYVQDDNDLAGHQKRPKVFRVYGAGRPVWTLMKRSAKPYTPANYPGNRPKKKAKPVAKKEWKPSEVTRNRTGLPKKKAAPTPVKAARKQHAVKPMRRIVAPKKSGAKFFVNKPASHWEADNWD